MKQRVRQLDLQPDLLAPKRRRARQGCELVEGARQLFRGFDQGRACQRPPSGFAPEDGGFLDEAGLGVVTRQQLRLVLRNVG